MTTITHKIGNLNKHTDIIFKKKGINGNPGVKKY